MGKEIFTFWDIEVKKNKFYHNKIPVPLRDVETENVLVFNKIAFDEKSTLVLYWLLV